MPPSVNREKRKRDDDEFARLRQEHSKSSRTALAMKHVKARKELRGCTSDVLQPVLISDQGEVLTSAPPPQKSMGLQNEKKYKTIIMGKSQHRVHDMVAIAFHGPPPSSSHTADHLNHTVDDNRAVNLRWACKSMQCKNRRSTPRMSSTQKVPIQSKSVAGAQSEEADWVDYASMGDAACQLGVARRGIEYALDTHRTFAGRRWRRKPIELMEGELVGWYPHEGHPNAIRVTSHGRYINSYNVIQSTRTPEAGEKSQYYQVHLPFCTTAKFLHVMVMETFWQAFDKIKPACPEGQQLEVHHVDHQPHNCHIDNLEWVTKSQNVRASFARDDRKCGGMTYAIPVIVTRARGKELPEPVRYDSLSQAAEASDMDLSYVSKICIGKLTTPTFDAHYAPQPAQTADEQWTATWIWCKKDTRPAWMRRTIVECVDATEQTLEDHSNAGDTKHRDLVRLTAYEAAGEALLQYVFLDAVTHGRKLLDVLEENRALVQTRVTEWTAERVRSSV